MRYCKLEIDTRSWQFLGSCCIDKFWVTLATSKIFGYYCWGWIVHFFDIHDIHLSRGISKFLAVKSKGKKKVKKIISDESEDGFFDDKENVYFATNSQSTESTKSSCNVRKARGKGVKGFDRRHWLNILYCSYVLSVRWWCTVVNNLVVL